MAEKKDKKWIQKAVNPKHKGFCTPETKKLVHLNVKH